MAAQRTKALGQAVDKLFERTANGIRPGLEIIEALLAELGNPHQQLAVIHVAGTNGKGSTCAMIESVLRHSGFKTGFYSSPHLISFSERFRVNGAIIGDTALHEYIARVEQAADAVEGYGLRAATFFEISTAIAFLYFADQAVDVAVIETGLGGTWDATNVVIPVVSVITHIDIDHTEYLGDTFEEIALEKAGIIKAGRMAVTAPQTDEVVSVLQHKATVVDAPLVMSAESVGIRILERSPEGQKLKIETQNRSVPPFWLPLVGAFQCENVALAVAAVELLSDIVDFDPAFKNGLEQVEWGARFECLADDPVIILDGSHNPSGARALLGALKENYSKSQIGFIFGFLGDKDVEGYLNVLRSVITRAWTVSLGGLRGASAENIAATAGRIGVTAVPVAILDAFSQAKAWAQEEPLRIICICGSLHLKQALAECES